MVSVRLGRAPLAGRLALAAPCMFLGNRSCARASARGLRAGYGALGALTRCCGARCMQPRTIAGAQCRAPVHAEKVCGRCEFLSALRVARRSQYFRRARPFNVAEFQLTLRPPARDNDWHMRCIIPSMELKQTWHASETGAIPSSRPLLVVVSGSAPASVPAPAPEPTPSVEPGAPTPAPLPAKPDLILAFFDWLCAGPVSKWEREMTRRARWRLA